MKTKFIQSTFVGCALAGFVVTAAAQGNSGSVPNVEKFSAKFNLVATPDAPEGAKGKASIRATINNDTNSSTLSLQTQGLDPGDYVVTGALSTGGDTGPLAGFTIDPPANTNSHAKLKSSLVTNLPPEVDVINITGLTVSSGGVAMLTSDLFDPANKSTATLNATISLTPGPAAPDAKGLAKLKSSVKKGVRKDNFIMIASGLPADTTFTVDVDGTDAGTVTSNKKGKVIVKGLPAGLTSIGTVSLKDETAATAVSAEF